MTDKIITPPNCPRCGTLMVKVRDKDYYGCPNWRPPGQNGCEGDLWFPDGRRKNGYPMIAFSYKVESKSNPGHFYQVKVYESGDVYCGCVADGMGKFCSHKQKMLLEVNALLEKVISNNIHGKQSNNGGDTGEAERTIEVSGVQHRTISLYRGLISCLYRVYCWCGEKKVHEFKRKEVNHLIGKVEYARFGDLIRFGGLVYKPKDNDGKSHKAEYGINMARAKQFFANEYKIPVQITVNQITNEIIAATYVSVKDFPSIVEFLTKDGLYDYEKLINVKVDWDKQAQAELPPVQNTLI